MVKYIDVGQRDLFYKKRMIITLLLIIGHWWQNQMAECGIHVNLLFGICPNINGTMSFVWLEKLEYYYSNIASPTLYDGEALKYIDYDLDLKVFPDGNYRILDQEEYRQHAREMGYSDELDKILKKQLDVLIDLAVKKGGPFDQNFTKKWYSFYQDLKEGYYGKSDYYK